MYSVSTRVCVSTCVRSHSFFGSLLTHTHPQPFHVGIPHACSMLRANWTSVVSQSFLVGNVLGCGKYSFNISLKCDRASSNWGLGLNHDLVQSGVACFPVDMSGSSITVFHGEKEIFSRTMTSGTMIYRPGAGFGWHQALGYEELMRMLDAEDSCNTLRIIRSGAPTQNSAC